MAWEEESIESGADFEEVGGKKNIMKIAIIAVIVIGLGAAGWFLKDKFLGGDEEKKAPATAETEKKAPEPEEEPEEGEAVSETGHRVNLEKFTINLSGSGTPHYLVTTIVLEVSTLELKDALMNMDDPLLYRIKTRHIINELLMQKSYDEIRDPSASKEIAMEIKFKLNRAYKDGKVINVYFSEFLVD